MAQLWIFWMGAIGSDYSVCCIVVALWHLPSMYQTWLGLALGDRGVDMISIVSRSTRPGYHSHWGQKEEKGNIRKKKTTLWVKFLCWLSPDQFWADSCKNKNWILTFEQFREVSILKWEARRQILDQQREKEKGLKTTWNFTKTKVYPKKGRRAKSKDKTDKKGGKQEPLARRACTQILWWGRADSCDYEGQKKKKLPLSAFHQNLIFAVQRI